MSNSFKSELYATNLFSCGHQVGSQDEGRKLIVSGQVKALFVIPEGFEQSVREGNTATVSMIVDESDPTVASLTKGQAQILVQSLSDEVARERVAGIIPAESEVAADLARASAVLAPAAENVNEPHNAAIAAFAMDLKRAVPLAQSLVPMPLGNDQQQCQQFTAFDQCMASRVLLSAQARVASDAQGQLSEAMAVSANAEAGRQRAIAAIALIDAASGKQSDVISSTSAALSVPVSLAFIEPYGTGRNGIDFLIPSILALIIFQGATFNLGRAVAGERRDGSLVRVFMTPTSNTTILVGTQLFYLLFEIARSALIVLAAALLFGVSIKGSPIDIFVIIALYAMGVTGIGMILSVVSKSQEQYMALSALVTLPVMFLAGVFFPVDTMPAILQGVAKILPLSYAADALRGVMIKGFTVGYVFNDVLFLTVFGFLTMGASVLLFKREMIR
ncbi:ABC-2 type transporter [Candidatus Burarchaeum australiense]|nr:ABC-2 type transporter [Candidatus Burarchaeum australiense]